MKKALPFIIAAAAIILAVGIILAVTLQEENYERYYVEEHLLGTLRSGDEDLSVYYFLIEDGTGIIDLCNEKNTVRQRIELPLQNEYYASLDYLDGFQLSLVKDINYDGLQDLYVVCSLTTENCQGMGWLQNKETGKLELCEPLSALPTVEFKDETKRVHSCDLSKEGDPVTIYKWNGINLVPVE
ncbi:MAG: hypothetical protein IKL24_02680 [Clostridia bacterium]|nr:hypothetical protein [Clostridia bacterium]